MNNVSLGDLVGSHIFRRQNTELRSDLNRYLEEVSSGRSATLRADLHGDFGALAGIERALTLQKSFDGAIGEAGRIAGGQQIALDSIRDSLAGRGARFLSAAAGGQGAQLPALLADAVLEFQGVVSALNTRIGDRSVFAGTATKGPALADAATMLADLQAATAGDLTAADVMATLDTWFDTAGGSFETMGYLGSTSPLAAFPIADGLGADLTVTAADERLRDTLKGYAAAALMAGGTLAGDNAERLRLLDSAGRLMLQGEGEVTQIQEDIGAVEGRIESARVRNGAETTSLALARDQIVGADPYEAATQLEEVQSRLEMLYTITARLSQLSLASVLR